MPRMAVPTLHQVFHRKYASWAIAFFGGAALTAALADQFKLAYGSILICCIFSIGWWLTSDRLEQKRPRGLVLLPDGTSNVPSARDYRLWQAIPSLLMIAFFGACAYSVHALQLAKELEQFEGWLYPANDPDLPCESKFPLPDNAIALYLGNSRLIAGRNVSRWPVLVPQDRRIASPILVVEQESRERIALDLDVRGEDGRIVARIQHNHFVLNRNNMLTKQRPDRSTLLVTDQKGTEVLNVRYINPHTIHVLGTFYVIGQKEPVVISEMRQDMGGGHIVVSGTCNASPDWDSDVFMWLTAFGDETGNHEHDLPGSSEHPLSPVRKWDAYTHEWEIQLVHR
jgi:hypothetical protein